MFVAAANVGPLATENVPRLSKPTAQASVQRKGARTSWCLPSWQEARPTTGRANQLLKPWEALVRAGEHRVVRFERRGTKPALFLVGGDTRLCAAWRLVPRFNGSAPRNVRDTQIEICCLAEARHLQVAAGRGCADRVVAGLADRERRTAHLHENRGAARVVGQQLRELLDGERRRLWVASVDESPRIGVRTALAGVAAAGGLLKRRWACRRQQENGSANNARSVFHD
jgi:hypothetical protein